MVPTRNNRGVAHENGAIESRHGHLKKRLAQALLLRGSASFADLDAYRAFAADVVGQHNRRHTALIDTERDVLRPLPSQSAMIWEERPSASPARRVLCAAMSSTPCHPGWSAIGCTRASMTTGSRPISTAASCSYRGHVRERVMHQSVKLLESRAFQQ